jgi:hypothetical protein
MTQKNALLLKDRNLGILERIQLSSFCYPI